MTEAAKALGISIQTIRRADAAGTMRVVRTPGGWRRIPQSEVDRLLGKTQPETIEDTECSR
jgi:putative resolvase